MCDEVLKKIEEMEDVEGVSIIVHQNIDASKITDFKCITLSHEGIASEIQEGWIVVRIQTEQYMESYNTYVYLAKLKVE